MLAFFFGLTLSYGMANQASYIRRLKFTLTHESGLDAVQATHFNVERPKQFAQMGMRARVHNGAFEVFGPKRASRGPAPQFVVSMIAKDQNLFGATFIEGKQIEQGIHLRLVSKAGLSMYRAIHSSDIHNRHVLCRMSVHLPPGGVSECAFAYQFETARAPCTWIVTGPNAALLKLTDFQICDAAGTNIACEVASRVVDLPNGQKALNYTTQSPIPYRARSVDGEEYWLKHVSGEKRRLPLPSSDLRVVDGQPEFQAYVYL